MSTKIKKVGVLTSGGDSPGMNAAIRAVVRACAYYNVECVGIYRGYQGMIEGDFKEMGPRDVKNIINKGGTILKSARSADFRTAEGRKKAYDNLESEGFTVTVHGKGTYVAATNTELLLEEQKKELEADLEQAIQKGRRCGISDEDIKSLFELILEG